MCIDIHTYGTYIITYVQTHIHTCIDIKTYTHTCVYVSKWFIHTYMQTLTYAFTWVYSRNLPCYEHMLTWNHVWICTNPVSLSENSNPRFKPLMKHGTYTLKWYRVSVPQILIYSYTQKHGSSMFESQVSEYLRDEESIFVASLRPLMRCHLALTWHVACCGGAIGWSVPVAKRGEVDGKRWQALTFCTPYHVYSFGVGGWDLLDTALCLSQRPCLFHGFPLLCWFGALLLPFSLDLTDVFF